MSKKKIIIIAIELIIIGILFVVIGCNELKKDKKKSVVTENTQNTEYAEKNNDDNKGLFSKLDSKKAEEEAKKREEEERLAAEARRKKIDEALELSQAYCDAGNYEEAINTLAAIENFESDERLSEAYATYVGFYEAEIAEQERLAKSASVLEETDLMAQMYDYDRAIETVKAFEGYEEIEEMVAAIASYEEQKAACVVWPDNTHISHLFVHSLIVDTARAFGPKSKQALGYNVNMVTVDEFNRMLEQLYERGYVIISVHDMAERVVGDDGVEKLVKKQILLPEGKIPFVFSQDDVNYYSTQDGDGLGERIVLDENGLPTVEYILEDGTAVYGEYDTVPIIDRFVREHPDFSYHGRKGILAITGFEGALGYDTGLSMPKYDGMSEEDKMAIINEERAKATAVADALKADGWEFASHSYTHGYMDKISLERFQYDHRRWSEEVAPILGNTDIYIYPYGNDICSWVAYKGDKFDVMREYGFWYFCNVQHNEQYWVQIREGYFRQARIDVDGQTLMLWPKDLRYFFDVDYVKDKSRPALK